MAILRAINRPALPLASSDSESAPRGIYRRKYRLRALFQSVAFIALLGFYSVYNNGNIGNVNNAINNGNRSFHNVQNDLFQRQSFENAVIGSAKRRLTMVDSGDITEHNLEEDLESIPYQHRRAAVDCDEIDVIEPAWMSAFFGIGVLYMFVAIAIVCDDFFVPALEVISDPDHMDLDSDVAGATLMAAGGSAPELFTNLFGTFTESNIGMGTIIGSATFNVLLVIAMCSICAKETLNLSWWPLFRDCTYYSVNLIILALFVGVSSPDEIEIWEAVILFLLYIGYVLIMWKNRDLHKSLTGKELVVPELNEETSADDDGGNLDSVKELFDQLDTQKNGAISEEQLRQLLNTVAANVENFNLENALAEIQQKQEEKEAENANTTWDDFVHWHRNCGLFKKKSEDEEEEPLYAALLFPEDASVWQKLWHVVKLPIVACLTFTVPNVERSGNEKYCYLAFLLSIGWIGVFAYFMVLWAEFIGDTIGVPHVVLGYTVLAAGTSVPDLLSSVIVTRQGSGDMAISSSIGSNIFDITVGLPVPWLIYQAFPGKPNRIAIDSANIWLSICIFLGMIVAVVFLIHCQGWRLTKTLGFAMFILYLGFLAQAIILELPFEACV